MADTAEFDGDALRFAADTVSRVEGAIRVDEKSRPGEATVGVRCFDAHDGPAALFKNRLGLLLESAQHFAGILIRRAKRGTAEQDPTGDEAQRPSLRNRRTPTAHNSQAAHP